MAAAENLCRRAFAKKPTQHARPEISENQARNKRNSKKPEENYK